ncbi:hypothetical protein FHS18_004009 [Paenibacillus phyllosphaerae]|uniref:VCBS repeat-containing protein n=1 Tax=Paenibacillus phyllosphaerae TaxID=274593 RepID=A0A7W5FP29_9BACL|nr:hypothetical protein [Paenibacillus phyllosphaerae]MBB3111941.1 hypothetical protein [Paenibacillus phyllosphaerae]
MKGRLWRTYTLRLAAAWAGLLVLAGCQYTATPADLLLAPQATAENAAIAAAVQDALPPRAKLTVTDQGKTTSAIRKEDVDGDGRKEVIVTYVNEREEEKVMVLTSGSGSGEQSASGWHHWFTFTESSGYGVDWIEVSDLDDNGQPELFIAWNSYGDPYHQVNVYTVQGGEELRQYPPAPLAELPYEMARLGDVDGDGQEELVLITHDRDNLRAALHLYRLSGKEMLDELSTPIDGSVSGYYNLAIGQIAKGRYGLVMDAGIGAHSSMTHMFAWEDGQLKRVYPPLSEGDEEHVNDSSTFGGDGNHDGVLDIELLTPAPGQAEDVPYSEMLWIEKRKQWDGEGNFITVQERYVDYEQGYAIRFKSEWYNKVTVSHSNSSADAENPIDEAAALLEAVPEGIVFEQYSEETGQRAPLFAIYMVPLDNWGAFEQNWKDNGVRYNQVLKAAGMIYAVEWKDAPADWSERDQERFVSLQPDVEELKREFELLPEY